MHIDGKKDSLGTNTNTYKSYNSVGSPTEVTETRSLRNSSLNGKSYYTLLVNSIVVPEGIFTSRHEAFQQFITLTRDLSSTSLEKIYYTENTSWTTIFDGDIQNVPTPSQKISKLKCILTRS